MTSTKHRAASATLWSGLEIAARYGTQFVVMIVLARLLLPEDFGLAAILLIFTSLGMLLIDGGFGTALIQRQHISQDDETTVFIFNIVTGFLAGTLLFLFAPTVAKFFDQPALTDLARLIAFVFPLGALAAVPDALLTMKLNFRARARAEVVASVCSGLLATMLAWKGFGVWSLVWHSVSGILIRAILLWHFSGWRPRGSYSAQSFHSLFGFGGYMLAAGILNAVAVRMQSLLIGKLFDARTLGYYTLAQNTQQAPASLVASLLSRVGLPIFSTIAGDREGLIAALRASIRISMFLFFPCMIGIAFTASTLISILYGDRWMPAAPILSILAVSAALWPMHVLNISAIGAQGKSQLLLRVEIVKQISTILLIVFSSKWGVIGIAWSVLASSILALALNTYYCGKLLGYGLFSQLRDQTATFFLTVTATALGWAVMHWSSPHSMSSLAALFFSSITYLLLAVLTKNSSLNGIISMILVLRSK